MSKKASELEAGALNAWTPIQQAALYHQFLSKQAEQDDAAALKEYEDAEKKRKRAEAGGEEVKPDKVQAGKIIDDLMKSRCRPLYEFLDLFGTPHIAVVPFILLHGAYWWSTPWYLHFVLTYPLLYLVPMYNTLKSIYTAKKNQDGQLWQSWWALLASVEYLEILLFRDNARSLVWWPKMKAVVFVLLYSVLYHEEKADSRGRKSKAPVIGALKFITVFLPKIEPEKKKDDKSEKDDDKARDRGKGHDGKASSKSGNREKEKAKTSSSKSDGKGDSKPKSSSEKKPEK